MSGSAATTIPSGLPNAQGSYVGTTSSPLNAKLAPLNNYGGHTQTMALLRGSPALNAAISSTSASDQRIYPIIGTADIGAYEAGTINQYAIWSLEAVGSSLSTTGDADNDGNSNLLEYASLTDPLNSNSINHLLFNRNAAGTQATLSFATRFNATDLSYAIQCSNNLSTWSTIYTYDGATQTGMPTLGVTVSTSLTSTTLVDTNITSQEKLFYRMQVTKP